VETGLRALKTSAMTPESSLVTAVQFNHAHYLVATT